MLKIYYYTIKFSGILSIYTHHGMNDERLTMHSMSTTSIVLNIIIMISNLAKVGRVRFHGSKEHCYSANKVSGMWSSSPPSSSAASARTT